MTEQSATQPEPSKKRALRGRMRNLFRRDKTTSDDDRSLSRVVRDHGESLTEGFRDIGRSMTSQMGSSIAKLRDDMDEPWPKGAVRPKRDLFGRIMYRSANPKRARLVVAALAVATAVIAALTFWLEPHTTTVTAIVMALFLAVLLVAWVRCGRALAYDDDERFEATIADWPSAQRRAARKERQREA